VSPRAGVEEAPLLPHPGTMGGICQNDGMMATKKRQPGGRIDMESLLVVLALARHQRQCEAVIALDAHRLDRRGTDPRLLLQHLIEATDASDAVVVALRIDDLAVADDIVDDDHAAWARELQRPGEVVRYVLLVGVNENEI